MSSGSWAAAVIVADRCIVAIGALRGAESKDRPAITMLCRILSLRGWAAVME
jgi:hypothetical protein